MFSNLTSDISIEQVATNDITPWLANKVMTLLTHQQNVGVSGQHKKISKSETKLANGVTFSRACISNILNYFQDQGYQKYGPLVVLKLEHEKGPVIFAWVPSSLVRALQNRERADYIIMINFRMRRSEETGNNYYAFKLA